MTVIKRFSLALICLFCLQLSAQAQPTYEVITPLEGYVNETSFANGGPLIASGDDIESKDFVFKLTNDTGTTWYATYEVKMFYKPPGQDTVYISTAASASPIAIPASSNVSVVVGQVEGTVSVAGLTYQTLVNVKYASNINMQTGVVAKFQNNMFLTAPGGGGPP